MTVKIISDEVITQINDQLKSSVKEMIKTEVRNYLSGQIHEIDADLQGIILDEVRNMDLVNEFRDDFQQIINEELDLILSDLVISRA